jgi:hypothetical protein
MEKHNPTEKRWIASLQGSDPQLIIQSIREIRNAEAITMLPVLLELVNKDTSQTVRNEIIELISELKAAEAAPFVAESLLKNDFGDYLSTVVAACWQSRLNFSKHLPVFANLFVRSDYKTALEAFTVIEESLGNADVSDIQNCLNFLTDSEYLVTNEKVPLYRELKKVVESF